MLTESEIIEVNKCLIKCESGYSSKTRVCFKYLIKICSRELGGKIGEVECSTCRRFVIGWFNKRIK